MRGESLVGKGTVMASSDAILYPLLMKFSREMRKEPTLAEDRLWQALRANQLDGLKFRRQHAIDTFIADFVNLEHQLVVEVDGGIHDQVDQAAYDIQRTQYLKQRGYTVIRFQNEEVLHDLPHVLTTIQGAVNLLKDSPLL